MRPRAKMAALAMGTLSAILILPEACRAPTQVTLEITYSGPCSELDAIGFIVATDPYVAESRIEEGVFTTSVGREQCTNGVGGAPSTIGTLVVTPNDDTNRSSIVVLASIGQTLDRCKAATGYFGCIVARRTFVFVAQTGLTLDVPLEADCKNVPCDAVSTCRKGACVSSSVDCTGEKCSKPGEAPDGGIITVDAPTSSDAYVQGDRIGDVIGPPVDAPADSPVDSPVDTGIDSGFCEMPDVPLTCTPQSGVPKPCAGGETCCFGFDNTGDGGGSSGSSGGGGTGQYNCRTACVSNGNEPQIHCRSARNCPTGQICCQQFPSGPVGCSTTCMGGFDGGFGTSQLCADDCECRNGGTCTVPVTVGNSPAQAMTKCSP